jgi:hypothetical protein
MAYLWRIFHPFQMFATFVLRVVTFPVDVLFFVLDVVWSEEKAMALLGFSFWGLLGSAPQLEIVSKFQKSEFVKVYRTYVRPICTDYFSLPLALYEPEEEIPVAPELEFWVIGADNIVSFDGYCDEAGRGAHDAIKEESVEKVDDSKGDYKLITPILTELVVLYMLYRVFIVFHIPEDYLTHVSMCPVLDYGKSWVGWLDTKLLYYLKEPLTQYCTTEDSFYKLFTDAWVRDVVTDTDDTMLLLYTRLKAFAFQAMLLVVLIPGISYVLGFLNLVFWVIENVILQKIVDGFLPNLKPGLKAMAQSVSSLKAYSPFDKNEAPPMTIWRYRDSRDSMECVLYAKNRVARYFQHFQESVKQDLEKLMGDLIFGVTFYRFICIWTHNLFDGYCVGRFLRVVLRLIGSYPLRLLKKHQIWFAQATSGMVGDRMVMNQVTGWAQEAEKGVLNLGSEVSVVGDMQMLLLQLVLGCFVVCGLIIWRLVVERQAFDEKYDEMMATTKKWPLTSSPAPPAAGPPAPLETYGDPVITRAEFEAMRASGTLDRLGKYAVPSNEIYQVFDQYAVPTPRRQ